FTKEVLRHLQMDSGAIPGLSVGVHRAAMPDRLECLDRAKHDLAPRFSVDSRDKSDSARIMLVLRRVGMSHLEQARIGDIALDLGLSFSAEGTVFHVHHSAAIADSRCFSR